MDVMLCVIWYYLYNSKNVKNTHGEKLLLVQAEAWQIKAYNFPKSNTLPWGIVQFFKLYKWYQIAQSVSYEDKSSLTFHFHKVDLGQSIQD